MDWPLVGDVLRIGKYGLDVLKGKRSVGSALLDGIPKAIGWVTSKIPGLNFLSGTIEKGLSGVADNIRHKHNIKGAIHFFDQSPGDELLI